jgi:small subunit ribosomal protein S21|tara:strand:- start:23417 stop:23839 length:423 start_codon:yes stop_codon:yes gene_type:complete
LNKDKGREGNKSYTKEWNNKKRDFAPKKEPHYLERYNGEIEVRNGDVGKALRILKRRLEKSDFQKELAKQQYYEKPSAKRNRKKKQAVKRWQKTVREMEAAGTMKQYLPTGTKYLKSKRKTRRVRDYNDRIATMQRKRGL